MKLKSLPFVAAFLVHSALSSTAFANAEPPVIEPNCPTISKIYTSSAQIYVNETAQVYTSLTFPFENGPRLFRTTDWKFVLDDGAGQQTVSTAQGLGQATLPTQRSGTLTITASLPATADCPLTSLTKKVSILPNCPYITSVQLDAASPLYVEDWASIRANVRNPSSASPAISRAAPEWTVSIRKPGSTTNDSLPTLRGSPVNIPTHLAGVLTLTAKLAKTAECAESSVKSTVKVIPVTITSITGDPGFKLRRGTRARFAAETARPTAVGWHIRTISSNGVLGEWRSIEVSPNGQISFCADEIGRFKFRASLSSGGVYSEIIKDLFVDGLKPSSYPAIPLYDFFEPKPAAGSEAKSLAAIRFELSQPATGTEQCLTDNVPSEMILKIWIERTSDFEPPNDQHNPWTELQKQQYAYFNVFLPLTHDLYLYDATVSEWISYESPSTFERVESTDNPSPPDPENPDGHPHNAIRKLFGVYRIPLDRNKTSYKAELNIGTPQLLGMVGEIQGMSVEEKLFWITNYSLMQFKFDVEWQWNGSKLMNVKVTNRKFKQSYRLAQDKDSWDLPARSFVPMEYLVPEEWQLEE